MGKGRGGTEGSISGGTAFKGEEAICGESYKWEEGIHGEGELEGLRMEARPIRGEEDQYMGNVL